MNLYTVFPSKKASGNMQSLSYFPLITLTKVNDSFIQLVVTFGLSSTQPGSDLEES